MPCLPVRELRDGSLLQRFGSPLYRREYSTYSTLFSVSSIVDFPHQVHDLLSDVSLADRMHDARTSLCAKFVSRLGWISRTGVSTDSQW